MSACMAAASASLSRTRRSSGRSSGVTGRGGSDSIVALQCALNLDRLRPEVGTAARRAARTVVRRTARPRRVGQPWAASLAKGSWRQAGWLSGMHATGRSARSASTDADGPLGNGSGHLSHVRGIDVFCERCGARQPLERRESAASGPALARRLRSAVTGTSADSQRLPTDSIFLRLCLDCRGYYCPNCWNNEAKVCQTCQPVPEPEAAELPTVFADSPYFVTDSSPEPEPVFPVLAGARARARSSRARAGLRCAERAGARAGLRSHRAGARAGLRCAEVEPSPSRSTCAGAGARAGRRRAEPEPEPVARAGLRRGRGRAGAGRVATSPSPSLSRSSLAEAEPEPEPVASRRVEPEPEPVDVAPEPEPVSPSRSRLRPSRARAGRRCRARARAGACRSSRAPSRRSQRPLTYAPARDPLPTAAPIARARRVNAATQSCRRHRHAAAADQLRRVRRAASLGRSPLSLPPPGVCARASAVRADGFQPRTRTSCRSQRHAPDSPVGVRPCHNCQLAVSAKAHFCRRCGAAQLAN